MIDCHDVICRKVGWRQVDEPKTEAFFLRKPMPDNPKFKSATPTGEIQHLIAVVFAADILGFFALQCQ
nr:hypothetical protein [Photorhabdus temperata]